MNPSHGVTRLWVWPVINYHHENGSVWADSPDVQGWTAIADDKAALDVLVDEARDVIFRPNGWPHAVANDTQEGT